MSVKRSLAIFMTIICLGLGGGAGLFVWSFYDNLHYLNRVEVALDEIQAIAKTRTAVHRQMKEILDYALSGKEFEKQQYAQFVREVDEGFKDWFDSSKRSQELGVRGEGEDLDLAQDLQERHQQLSAQLADIIEMLDPKAKALANLEELEPFMDQLLNDMDKVVEEEVGEANDAYQKILFRTGVLPWMAESILDQVKESQLALSYLLAIEEVKTQSTRQAKELSELLLSDKEKDQREYELAKGKKIEAMEEWIDVVEIQMELGVPGEEEDLTFAGSVETQLQEIDDLSQQGWLMVRTGNIENVIKLVVSQIETRLDQTLLPDLEKAAKDAREEIASSHKNLIDLIFGAWILVLIVLAGLAFIIIVVVRKLMSRIIFSLNILKKGTETIGGGQLDQRIPMTFKDEFGELATAFNSMADKLQHSYTELEGKVRDRTRELESKNAELERFTYTASHDLKSPLITIRGFVGMLEKDLAKGNAESCQRDIQRIYDATKIMQTLLDDLLNYSRVGHLVPQLGELSMRELADIALGLVAGQIENGKIGIDLSPDLPVVFGDRTRLLEVYQNLIENAVKYMGPEPYPHIDIGVRQDGDEVVFYVKDNGIGIEPRYHGKVFGLFEQLGSSSGGTGLGLALVKQIIESHNGRIWVESQGQGQGSTFCWTLPRSQGG